MTKKTAIIILITVPVLVFGVFLAFSSAFGGFKKAVPASNGGSAGTDDKKNAGLDSPPVAGEEKAASPEAESPLDLSTVSDEELKRMEFKVDPASVTVDPWLNGYSYRKPITISSGGALTNYQINIAIDTLTLANNSKMRTDCNDLRFTSDNGYTLIDYWIASGCHTGSTSLWIEVPSIANGNTTIYMYYGSSSASAASNFLNTMAMPTGNPTFTGAGYGGGWSETNPGDTLNPDGVYGYMYLNDVWNSQWAEDYWVYDFGSSARRYFTITWKNSAVQYTGYCTSYTTTVSGSPDGSSWTTIASLTLTSTSSSAVWNSTTTATYRYIKVDAYSTSSCMVHPGYTYVDTVWAYGSASSPPTTSVGSETQLITRAGTGAASWTWKAPAINDKVSSGSAASWSWVTWQDNGAGLTVPYSAAASWTWYP